MAPIMLVGLTWQTIKRGCMDDVTDKGSAPKPPEIDLSKLSEILSRPPQKPAAPADVPVAPKPAADVPVLPIAPVKPAAPEVDARTRRAESILEGFRTGKTADKLADEIVRAFKAEPTQADQEALAKYLNDRAPARVSFTPQRVNQNALLMEVRVTGLKESAMRLPLGHPSGEDWVRPTSPRPPSSAPMLPSGRPETSTLPSAKTPFQMPALPVPGAADVPPRRTGADLPVPPRTIDVPPARPVPSGTVTDGGRSRNSTLIGDAIRTKGEGAVDDIQRVFQSIGTAAGQRALAQELNRDLPGYNFSIGMATRVATQVTVTGLDQRRRQPFVISLGRPRDEPYR
jgi:hypothetical protein